MANWLARFILGETQPKRKITASNPPSSVKPAPKSTEMVDNIRRQVGGPPSIQPARLPPDNGVKRTLASDADRARSVVRNWLKQGD